MGKLVEAAGTLRGVRVAQGRGGMRSADVRHHCIMGAVLFPAAWHGNSCRNCGDTGMLLRALGFSFPVGRVFSFLAAQYMHAMKDML